MLEINLAYTPLTQAVILDAIQQQWEQDQFSTFQLSAGPFARRVLRQLWPVNMECSCAKADKDVIETDFGRILLCHAPDRSFEGLDLEQRSHHFARIVNFSRNAADYPLENPLDEINERLKRIEAQLFPNGGRR